MTDVYAPVNNSPREGKIDVRRLEAARERRARQIEEWNIYDQQMSTKESTPKSLNRINTNVKFLDKYLLLDAALRNDVVDANRLLREGINPNVAKEDGLTALHQACINGCLELCQVLVGNGADVNSRDADQWTPLHAAATCGHVDICRFLISSRADILAANVDGSMPYDIAEDEETADLFLNEIERRRISKADVEAARSVPERLMIDDLLSMYNGGEDVNTLDSQGATALHIAAACNYIDVTNLLLRIGVDPDTRDFESWTPAHIAACWGQLEVLRVLIAHGADLDLSTPSDHTAFTLCESTEMHDQLCEIWDDRHNLQARLREEHPPPVSRINRRRSQSSVHRSSIGDKWKFSRSEVMQEVRLGMNTDINTLDVFDEGKGYGDPSNFGNKDSLSLSTTGSSVKNIIIIPRAVTSPRRHDGVDSPSSSPVRSRDQGRVIQIVHEDKPDSAYLSTRSWNQDDFNKGDYRENWDNLPNTNDNPSSRKPKTRTEMEVRTRPVVIDHRGDPNHRQSRPNGKNIIPAETFPKFGGGVQNPIASQPETENNPIQTSEADTNGSIAYSTCCKNCTLL